MKIFNRLLFSLAMIFVLLSVLVVSAFAETNVNYDMLFKNNGPVMSMSHRGDSAFYPSNSLEAVLSDCEKGADMISVSVQKTADNVLVLCEDKPLSAICQTAFGNISQVTYDEVRKFHMYAPNGTVSDCTIPTLASVIEAVNGKSLLVIDNAWEYHDDIYSLCSSLDAADKVILRTDANSKQIASWVEENSGEGCIPVIGIYDGNIVFNAISHLNRLTALGQPAVQYQSKNYFNVMYDSFTAKRYSANGSARAIAPMYDKDLCGQREDNVDGWDEMIERGFSIIETNNVAGLEEYISQCAESMNRLSAMIDEAEKADLSIYSQVSVKNFSESLKNAKALNASASLGEIQRCSSALTQTMNNLAFNTSEDVQKGNLNITAGKIIAVIIFGSLILAGEIYVHKMHESKKGKKH
ncbi:MAG: glycerophosphodiester phosphodiesterase family protein [Faecalibacterium sp.]|nr:glycerophosphodiester phosphodiesterase family protein [Ruminococcus sp.]MCM1391142.1 glycerophosphodiester phosphodiesterase family protein [Ruminococcus sp.]MCM1486230.1 glycerophosphodiester phosphodiesterase family protein [Faecalibacterium sp.]